MTEPVNPVIRDGVETILASGMAPAVMLAELAPYAAATMLDLGRCPFCRRKLAAPGRPSCLGVHDKGELTPHGTA